MSPLQPIGNNNSSGSHKSLNNERLTPTSVFLSFLLTLTLIGIGQRGLLDLNRKFNPHWESCNQVQYLTSRGESCPIEKNAFQQVLLHSYVSLPLFLFFLGLMLFLRHRRLSTWQKAMFRVSGTVSIFFGIEFLLETIIYLFQYHRILGWYFSLGVMAALLITLVIYMERRQQHKRSTNGH